jgi:hypothetical protein
VRRKVQQHYWNREKWSGGERGPGVTGLEQWEFLKVALPKSWDHFRDHKQEGRSEGTLYPNSQAECQDLAGQFRRRESHSQLVEATGGIPESIPGVMKPGTCDREMIQATLH